MIINFFKGCRIEAVGFAVFFGCLEICNFDIDFGQKKLDMRLTSIMISELLLDVVKLEDVLRDLFDQLSVGGRVVHLLYYY